MDHGARFDLSEAKTWAATGGHYVYSMGGRADRIANSFPCRVPIGSESGGQTIEMNGCVKFI